MTNLFDLTGETAVVIGGTGVLGGAIAEGLAAAGAGVAILGRNAERGQARVEAIRNAGGAAEFFPADALSRENLDAARAAVTGSLGAPTILVNTAGGNDPKVTVTAERPFDQIGLDDWRLMPALWLIPVGLAILVIDLFLGNLMYSTYNRLYPDSPGLF